MERFEYEYVGWQRVAQHGRDGWRLVCPFNFSGDNSHFIMERPIPQSPPESGAEALTHENVSKVYRLYKTARAVCDAYYNGHILEGPMTELLGALHIYEAGAKP